MTSSRHLERNSIERKQFSKLRALLKALIPANRFYAKKLEAAGVNLEIASADDFKKLPFTLKEELVEDQRRNPPYGSNLTFPLRCYTRLSQTSATSGQPLRWLDTPESWQWMLDNWEKIYRASDVSAEDRIFFAFSFAPFLGFWTGFEAGVRLGCLSIPGGGLNSVGRLSLVIENNVTVLCCTPTYALRLAEVAAENKIELAEARVRRVIVAGEPGGSVTSTRERIERLWPGARVIDHHGMTEVGPVSYGCTKRPGVLHVIESAYIPEIIEPGSDRAVVPGESGELVLTNLGRLGSPLLRYRTGDLVQAVTGTPCECGSYELALKGGILGRTDEMLILRGVNVYPSLIENVIRAFQNVAEYRVELHINRTLPQLNVQIEATFECQDPDGLTRQVEEALQAALSLRVPVHMLPRGSLPRFEMKARRWVTL